MSKIQNGATKTKKIILPFLARHSVFNLLSYEKTGIYVKDNLFSSQNIKTELKNLI